MNADWVTAIGTMLGGLGAIGLLAVASQGVDAWRNQMVGKEEYDVAKAIVKVLLKVREFTHNFELDWNIIGRRAKWNMWEEWEAINNAFNDADADACILWGRHWGRDKVYNIVNSLFELAHGSECEVEDKSEQKELIDTIRKDTYAFIEEMREKALGVRTV